MAPSGVAVSVPQPWPPRIPFSYASFSLYPCVRVGLQQLYASVPTYGGLAWFLLARGPLLVLPGVLATNTPSLRLTLMNMILQTSLVLQVWYLPWKAPILNLVDALSMSLLVMLVNVALGYADNSGRFATEVLQSLGTVTCALSYSALSF